MATPTSSSGGRIQSYKNQVRATSSVICLLDADTVWQVGGHVCLLTRETSMGDIQVCACWLAQCIRSTLIDNTWKS